jgi:hypothetical protein
LSVAIPDTANFLSRMKAAEIIAELKGLPPQDFAEVSAFVLSAERKDPALQVALQRKRESTSGITENVPYAKARARAAAAVAPRS